MKSPSNEPTFLSKGNGARLMIRNIYLILALFLTYDTVAQERFTRIIPDSPMISDVPMRIQYNFEGGDHWQQVIFPVPSECTILDSTEEKHMSFPTGKKNLQKGWTKTYIVSFPKPGTFLLPAAFIRSGGKTLKVPSQPIQVLAKNNFRRKEFTHQEPKVALDENSLLKKGDSPEKKITKLIFITVESNTPSCLIGEDITVIYKLFVRVHASSEVIRRPSFPGCSVIDMMKSYDAEPEIEWRNGSAYYSYIIRKVHIFPLRAGPLNLDEAEVETVVHFKKETSGSDSLQSVHFPATIRSIPRSIEVKSLPRLSTSNQSDMAVGQFNITLRSDKNTYSPGELAEASVIISGKGNWPMIGEPSLQWPSSLKVIGPEITERYDASTYPLKGEKTFLYKFITTDTGIINFPEVSIRYFDPESFEYQEARSTRLHVTVSTRHPDTPLKKEPSVNTPSEKGRELVYYYFGVLVLLALGWITYNIRGKK